MFKVTGEHLTIIDHPKCPRWDRTALRLTSIGVVFLVATVIGPPPTVSTLKATCPDMEIKVLPEGLPWLSPKLQSCFAYYPTLVPIMILLLLT